MHRPSHYMIREHRISPAVVLAPMEGVTDLPFRRLIRRIGGVGLTCTEFLPSSMLKANGSPRLWEMAQFDPNERPISIQIFGKDVEQMADAARLIEAHGADIVDINMGCPSKKVCKNSGGSALMAEPLLARRIVAAIVKAVKVPVTVKMRSGFDHTQRNADELAYWCQEEGASAVAIHWRTREDRYKGRRKVDRIAAAVDRLSIPVIANGDIVDIPSAKAMLEDTGCAGLMLGRGTIRNPFLPRQISQYLAGEEPTEVTLADRKDAMLTYFDNVQTTFRHPPKGLGRWKLMARYCADDLPESEDYTYRFFRTRSYDEARDCTLEYFAARGV